MKRLIAVCLVMSIGALSTALAASSATAGPLDFACSQDTECFATGE
jgi:hypothetical protein